MPPWENILLDLQSAMQSTKSTTMVNYVPEGGDFRAIFPLLPGMASTDWRLGKPPAYRCTWRKLLLRYAEGWQVFGRAVDPDQKGYNHTNNGNQVNSTNGCLPVVVANNFSLSDQSTSCDSLEQIILRQA